MHTIGLVAAILAEAPAANTAGFWNQGKVIGIITAALVVAVALGALSLAASARKQQFSHIAESLIKYVLILGFFVIVVGGAVWKVVDALAGLQQ